MERATARRGIVREQLLEVASELFARQGYRATTLDDVAAALDLKKASLYHYIESKDDLLTGIYERIFTRIRQAVESIAAEDVPADERLRRMIFAHLDVVGREREMLAVAFQEEAELPAVHREQIRGHKRDYQRIFETTVAEGQEQGILRSGSPRLMVRALFGMCNWIYKWYRSERDDLEEIASVFTTLLERGWLAVEGQERRTSWPRYDTVDDALAPSLEAASKLAGDVAKLEQQLERTRQRLVEGLAKPVRDGAGRERME